nr:DUF3040 domain-containing protein [Corynebacterium diphtheriae]
MALSDHELRALREIERSLLAEDPKFGASVNGVGANGGLGIGVLRSVSIMVLGLVMLVGGVALSQHTLWFIVLAIAGFIVMLAGGIWFVRGSRGEENYLFRLREDLRTCRRKLKAESPTGWKRTSVSVSKDKFIG